MILCNVAKMSSYPALIDVTTVFIFNKSYTCDVGQNRYIKKINFVYILELNRHEIWKRMSQETNCMNSFRFKCLNLSCRGHRFARFLFKRTTLFKNILNNYYYSLIAEWYYCNKEYSTNSASWHKSPSRIFLFSRDLSETALLQFQSAKSVMFQWILRMFSKTS